MFAICTYDDHKVEEAVVIKHYVKLLAKLIDHKDQKIHLVSVIFLDWLLFNFKIAAPFKNAS